MARDKYLVACTPDVTTGDLLTRLGLDVAYFTARAHSAPCPRRRAVYLSAARRSARAVATVTGEAVVPVR